MENPDSAVWEHFTFSTDFRDGRGKKDALIKSCISTTFNSDQTYNSLIDQLTLKWENMNVKYNWQKKINKLAKVPTELPVEFKQPVANIRNWSAGVFMAADIQSYTVIESNRSTL